MRADTTGPFRILIADDAQVVLERLTRALLAIRGVGSIETCTSRQRAIRSIERALPHLTILDVSLQDGNGYDVLQYIRHQSDDSPVFIFTNESDAVVRRFFLNGGATGFYDKSLDFHALHAAVADEVNKTLTPCGHTH